jgi:peptide chain release factor 1
MLDEGIRNALETEKQRFEELQNSLADPEVMANATRLRALARQSGALQRRVTLFKEYLELERRYEDAVDMSRTESDAEMKELARQEFRDLEPDVEERAELLKRDLLSRDRFSDRNVIVEIRAGTGGGEATLFANDLARMYQRFAERHSFKFEEMSLHRSEVGGIKEITFSIEGASVYDHFRFESGTHRVQRVPSTETQGRIHTSAATVAVLPEPEDLEVEIKDSDLKVETFRAGGPGGQNVNKTSSAVRITHLPSQVVVSCQDESSQHKNKSKAMRTLRSRLFEVQQRAQKEERDSSRRAQIGTGDRSEKIRTYNFPQDRVTDHRVKQSFHNLPAILDGDLDGLVDALRQFEVDQRLQEMQRSARATAADQGDSSHG